MKKCPKCNAELQDEARFCLFCMTSFETKQTIEATTEKSNRKFYIIILILILALIISSFVIFIINGTDLVDENNTSHNSLVDSNPVIIGSSNTSSNNGNNNGVTNIPSSQTSSNEQSEYSQSQTVSNNESSNQSSVVATSSQNTSQNSVIATSSQITSNNTSTSSTASSDVPSTSASSNPTSSETTSSTPLVVTPKFSYITAATENTYPTGSTTTYHPDNAIVITRVDYVEPNGIYVIPDTIDGKKVAAIMPSAFSDPSVSSTVVSVTLPSTVRTIWGNAFENCIYLKDLYLKSTTIAIYEDAFPDASDRKANLVIHCKRDCKNFDFYYYRNIANKYGATYQEWNG